MSNADTGTGLAVKEAGSNAASLITSAGGKRLLRRQGAGVGAGCDSLLSDADSGTGLAVKEAGQNAAGLLTSAGAQRRQLDKVGAGAASVVNVADPQLASDVTAQADALDGDGTGDSALLGQQLGSEEVLTGTEVGNLVPSSAKTPATRRQLDKVGAGAAAVVNVADPSLANDVTAQSDALDGDGTGDSALVGQQLGSEEVLTGTEVGNLVPSNAKTVSK